MPGPLPKPGAHRRRGGAVAAARVLPAVFDGPVPKYPLGRLSKVDSARWRELWALPQAAAWTHLHMLDQVVRYFALSLLVDRVLAAGDAPKAALLSELRAHEDRLALTPMSLARLRWTIADPADVVDLPVAPTVRRVRRVRAVDPATTTS